MSCNYDPAGVGITFKEDETFVTKLRQNSYEDRLVIGEGKIFFLSDCRDQWTQQCCSILISRPLASNCTAESSNLLLISLSQSDQTAFSIRDHYEFELVSKMFEFIQFF